MASANAQPTRSPSPCIHPTAFMPTMTVTMLASDMVHWSTFAGIGRERRAMGLVAPVGRKNKG
eukprot:7450114-Alexandrium_andersonii.AAC.1